MNGFGDREGIESDLGGIEAVPDLREVDGDMDVEPGLPKESGDGELSGDIFCDKIRTIHVFTEVKQRSTD